MYIPFESLPDNSRVWIYQSDREFTTEEALQIEEKGKEFVEHWTAHQQTLMAGFKIFHHIFLVLSADESHYGASGCSIDKSVHFISEIEKEFKVNLFNRLNLVYLQNEKNHIVHFSKFKELLVQQKVNLETKIFNNLISTKGDLSKCWLVNLNDSWVGEKIL